MSFTFSTKEDATLARLLAHMQAVREHWASIVYLKEALVIEDDLMFREAWDELGHEVQKILWVAPLYGGVWTTAERILMRKWGA